MQFEELWEEVGKQKKLPEAAIDTIPSMLSETTKDMLKAMEPYEVYKVIKATIAEINDGSVEPLNSIVLKRINDWTHISDSGVEK